MKHNRKGVAIQSVVISIVIISFFIVGLYFVYADGAAQYGINVNDTYANETFNKITEVNDIAEDIGGQIDSSEAVVTDNFFTFLTLPFKTLKIVFASFDIVLSLASEAKSLLGIPDLAFTMFITVVLIVIVFAIISALLSRST